MMTPKEYLRQSYRLDQRINSDIKEESLRSLILLQLKSEEKSNWKV